MSLSVLAHQLVQAKNWRSIENLLLNASAETLPIEELISAARTLDRELEHLPLPDRRSHKIVSQSNAVRLLAGECLAQRLRHDPLAPHERPYLVLAADLLMAGGNPKKAAALFERVGQDARAAEAYGLSGDIENMERCHDKLDQVRGAKHVASQLTRKVESLIEAGERHAALQLMEAAPIEKLVSAGLSDCFKNLAQRLCRGRALTLRINGNQSELLRVCGVPAIIGRQPGCELQLRDPSVSRQHASILAVGGTFLVQDAGSRSGTTVGDARLVGSVPLPSELELGLSQSCRLLVETLSDTNAVAVLRLQGRAGIDKGLRAFVVQERLELHVAIPALSGVSILIVESVLRLERLVSQPVRVAGKYVGLKCDLMIGDVIEIPINGEKNPIVLEVVV